MKKELAHTHTHTEKNIQCELLCIGSIKHARVDEEWTDNGGLHSVYSCGQQLQSHRLRKAYCSELTGTVVYKQDKGEGLGMCFYAAICLSE